MVESDYRVVREKSYINGFLVAVNVVWFIVLAFQGLTTDAYFMAAHGAMFGPKITLEHEYYRFFTSMFMHFGFQHLLSNMIALFFIGDNMERALGHGKYLLFYLLSGIGASVVSYIGHTLNNPYTVSAGASGAICGVIGGLLYVVQANRGRLEDMTTGRVGFLIVYLLYSGFTSTGVDNIAHISGLILGYLLAFFLYEKPIQNYEYEGYGVVLEPQSKTNKMKPFFGLFLYILALGITLFICENLFYMMAFYN